MPALLYCCGESKNAYKTALTTVIVSCDWQPVWVDFFNSAAWHPDFLSLNDMGEASLLLEGDLTLTESCVIQLHIGERVGRFQADDRVGMTRWSLSDAQKGSDQQGILRFLRNFLPVEQALQGGRWLDRFAASLWPFRGSRPSTHRISERRTHV